jgi:hypothetical protein
MRKITIVIIIAICVLVLAAGYMITVNKPSTANNQPGQEAPTATPANTGNTMPNNTLSGNAPSIEPTPISTNETEISPSPTEQTGDNGTYDIRIRVSIVQGPAINDNDLTMTLYKIIPGATTGNIVSLSKGNTVGLVKVDNTLTAPNADISTGLNAGPYYLFENASYNDSYLIEVEWNGLGWYVYPSLFQQAWPESVEVMYNRSFAINNTNTMV